MHSGEQLGGILETRSYLHAAVEIDTIGVAVGKELRDGPCVQPAGKYPRMRETERGELLHIEVASRPSSTGRVPGIQHIISAVRLPLIQQSLQLRKILTVLRPENTDDALRTDKLCIVRILSSMELSEVQMRLFHDGGNFFRSLPDKDADACGETCGDSSRA